MIPHRPETFGPENHPHGVDPRNPASFDTAAPSWPPTPPKTGWYLEPVTDLALGTASLVSQISKCYRGHIKLLVTWDISKQEEYWVEPCF